jgi:hypothetical protein
MSSNPIIPPSDEPPFNVAAGGQVFYVGYDDNVGGGDDNSNEVEEVTPSPFMVGGKRKPKLTTDKLKKPKTGTTFVIQEQVTKIVDSASTVAARKLCEVTIKELMEHVLESCVWVHKLHKYMLISTLIRIHQEHRS